MEDTRLWFSEGHRRVWDATCLHDLATCKERYRLSRVEGLYPLPRDDRPQTGVHLTFGKLLHSMAEEYDTCDYLNPLAGDPALNALALVMRSAWQEDKPFGGYVLDQWTCTGIELRGRTQRRHFLCDAAKDWWIGSDETCPHCGRPTKRKRAYAHEHMRKNLRSLARSVAAYEAHRKETDWHVAEWNGKPGLEITLSAPLPGTDYIIVGTLDRLSLNSRGELWVHERKTTSLTPGYSYWDSFDMRIQVGLYIWLCQQNGIHVHGALVECFQISASTVDVTERTFTRSPSQIEEMIAEVRYLLTGTHHLPARNWSACDHAAGGQACQYRQICAAAPADRDDIIAMRYGREPLWNPLEAERNDHSNMENDDEAST